MIEPTSPETTESASAWQALDEQLDAICARPEARFTPPDTLYHYTSWGGVEGILHSQEVWATSYAHTNDGMELRTADDAIRDIASELQRTRTGNAALVAALLLEKYDELAVSRFVPTYLTCFSQARDLGTQWEMYGDSGRGACLGVRVLRGDVPLSDPSYDRVLLPVGYSEATVRENLRRAFTEVADTLTQHYPTFDGDPEPFVLAVTALYRLAGIANIGTKEPKWQQEQEWRLVIFPKPDVVLTPLVRLSGGKEIPYLSVPLRAGMLISLDEITIGPSQDAADGRRKAEDILAKCGYRNNMPEWPKITVSGRQDSPP